MQEFEFGFNEATGNCHVTYVQPRFGALGITHQKMFIEIELCLVFEMLMAMIIELSPRFPVSNDSDLDYYKDKIEMELFDLFTKRFGLTASSLSPAMRASPLKMFQFKMGRQTEEGTVLNSGDWFLSIFQD